MQPSNIIKYLLLMAFAEICLGTEVPPSLPLFKLQSMHQTLEPKDLNPLLSMLPKDRYLSPYLESLALAMYAKNGSRGLTDFNDFWLVQLGLALEEKARLDEALKIYERVSTKDETQYQNSIYYSALILYRQNKIDAAIAKITSLPTLNDHLTLLLARLYFAKKEYLKSVTAYRQVDKNSPLFFTALKEEVWPLYKAQHIRHALGMIYSAQSPFFAGRYAPELELLKSTLNYAICRYEDAHLALTHFTKTYEPFVLEIQTYLESHKLVSQKHFQTFDNFAHGVEAKTLGLPAVILRDMLSQADLQEITQLLQTQEKELDALQQIGPELNAAVVATHKQYVHNEINELKNRLSQGVAHYLAASKDRLEKLISQAKLLSLEILMSRKEQLLGSELHKDLKIATLASDYTTLFANRKQMQTYGEDNKQEYWWDEIGHHVSALPDQCIKN